MKKLNNEGEVICWRSPWESMMVFEPVALKSLQMMKGRLWEEMISRRSSNSFMKDDVTGPCERCIDEMMKEVLLLLNSG